MSISARQIIQRALARIHIIGPNDTLSPEDAATGLNVLNTGIIEPWNARELLPPVQARSLYTLSPNVGTYTLGPTGATLTGPRVTPMTLEDVAVIAAGQSNELPVEILTRQRYNREPFKTLTQDFFTKFYLEPTLPNVTVTVLPTPLTACRLVIYSKGQLTSFADLDTAYNFPEGYAWALMTRLAILLCPDYEVQASADLIQQATDAETFIVRANDAYDVPELEADGGGFFSGGGGYNIRGDSFQ